MGDASRERIVVATLILVSLLAAVPVWGPGMVNTRGGGDSPFLLQRTHQLLANLRAGVFPVRWMPDAAYGLGYPFFSYYAALPYYLAGFLALIGIDILTTLKLVQTMGFIAAALATYGWMCRATGNRWAAWLAAIAYTVAPFHLVNVYVRGDSLSEFYAFIFYPLILWSLDALSEPASPQSGIRNPRSVTCNLQFAAAALAFAGLILTHNISAFIFSPFALLYLVMLSWRQRAARWQVLGTGLLALGFGFLLSAWFWFPALAELGHVQLGPSTQDFFHYSRHFRTLNLVQPGFSFDFSTTTNHRVRSPFAMGLVQAAFATLGGLVLIVRLVPGSWQRPTGSIAERPKTHGAFVLLGLFISTLMITPLSQFLWDHLPLLPVVQFPWRFLSVQALFAAAATAALVPAQYPTPNAQYPIPNTQHPTRSPLSIFHSLFSILPAVFLIASTLLSLHPERLAVSPADVTVERLQLYELFAGNVGTTIRYEWLPNTANPRPFTSDRLIEPDASSPAIPLNRASLQAALVERKPTRQVWQVWGAGGEIAFPLLYWPGWKARVGSEPTKVWPVQGSGYLALQVPPGEHTVTLWLGRTPVRTAAEITSLAAFVALLIIIAKSIPNPESRIPNRKSHLGHWTLVILASLVICYLSSVILPRATFDDEPALSDLTMDFVKMPYLHHNPGGVDFDGVVRLAGYTLSAEELAPGATLTVDLNWSQVTGPFTATLQLVSPAAVRYDVDPLAKTTSSLQPPTSNLQPPTSSLQYPISTPITLQLPQNIARGVYLIQLNLSGSDGKLQARTPGGKGQGTLYLRPVHVAQGPRLPRDLAVLAAFGPAIRLYAATVTQLAPDRMAVQLDWSAVYPLAANYPVSLRLLDARGQVRAQLDTQPGYGFLPTSSWRPGERVTDRYVLALPDDLPAEAGYHIEIVLYQASTLESVGQMQVGGFALPLKASFEARRPPRTFSLPSRGFSLAVDFGGEVRLAGFDLAPGQGEEEQENAIRLTLWWQALQNPQADYTVFVHLFDPDTDSLVTQSDAQPRGGTYPTSWWTTGEVISDTVTLSLEDTPEGTYRLAVGLYDQTFARLPAVPRAEQEEVIISQDRLILPAVVTVKR
jgi:hypothetical protein